MKKVIGIFVVMILMALMATVTYGEDSVDFKDYDWIGFTKEDFNKAEENGELIPEAYGSYLYEGVLYSNTEIWMNMDISDWGIESEDYYYKLDEMIEQELETIGIKHASVSVRRIGKDYNGQWLYDVKMITMYNLNDYTNENTDKFGSGFVKENFEYYGVRCITHLIPEY